jgi:SSS family solute:Na+ symporter
VSLLVKVGALAFVLRLSTTYAIQFQLLGGIWMVQLLPGLVAGLYGWRVGSRALLAGWATGMIAGTAMAGSLQLKSSIYPLQIFGHTYAVYAAMPALLANFAVAGLWTVAMQSTGGSRAESVPAGA